MQKKIMIEFYSSVIIVYLIIYTIISFITFDLLWGFCTWYGRLAFVFTLLFVLIVAIINADDYKTYAQHKLKRYLEE